MPQSNRNTFCQRTDTYRFGSRLCSGGFTQLELLLAVGLLAILLSLGGVFFGGFVHQDQIYTETDRIQNLIQEARARAVAGYTLGGMEALNFGVYFASDRYVLFPGAVFLEDEPFNQVFVLPDGWGFTDISLPDNSVVFAKKTGEVAGFDPLADFVLLSDTRTGQSRRISVNLLGTVTISEP